MNRVTVIQELINNFGYQRYLEIGTHKGKSFLPVKCKYKTAIDPSFRISIPFIIKWLYKNPQNLRNWYFQMTSDKFFAKKKSYLRKRKQDIIFIDGLHTFEASLKDVLNSLNYLAPGGTVVLHDCFPPTKAAATPARSLKEASQMKIPNWEGAWCGDVWKTIVYLKVLYKDDLEIFVLNTDLGIGVIQIKENRFLNNQINSIVYNKIKLLTYDNLIKDPEHLINLKKEIYLKDFT